LYPRASRRLTRRLALVSAVAALALLPSTTGSAMTLPTAAAGIPPATSSFYVFGSFVDVCGPGATGQCPLYDDAAEATVPPLGGMTILDFGAPCFEPATLAWGIQLFNSQSCTPNATVVLLAQAWVRGYETNPHRSASPGYVLVVGTSNSLTAAVPGNGLTSAEMSSHGQAWFSSVVSPITAFAQGLSSGVTIWAGNDIEESRDGNWYDGPTTAAWVDAYATASGASKPCAPSRNGLMANYGDYVPNEPGWSPAWVYHVSWQAAAACPVPEIYDAANALEWQSLNQYAQSAGLPQMQFTGVISEDGAAGTLSSAASWDNLRIASGQSVPFLTVIGEVRAIRPEVPDPPMTVTVTPGLGMVMLSWSQPAWDGGAAVTSFTVTVQAGSSVAQVLVVNGAPLPESTVVMGLVNGRSYTFYVSATNRVGTGPQSLPSRSAVPSARFTWR
jgi:fibronectin type III domain protein